MIWAIKGSEGGGEVVLEGPAPALLLQYGHDVGAGCPHDADANVGFAVEAREAAPVFQSIFYFSLRVLYPV